MSAFSTPFLQVFNKLLSGGVDGFTSRHDAYRVRSINSLCLFCIIISVPFYFIFFSQSIYIAALVILAAHILFVLTIWCNSSKKFNLGKVCLLLATNGSVLALSIMFGSQSGFYLYNYTSPLFVFWLFSNSRKRLIILTFFGYIGLMFLVFFFDIKLGSVYNNNFNLYGFDLYRLNAILNLILVFLLFHNYFEYQNILNNDLLSKQKSLENEIVKRIESEEKTKKLFDELTSSYKNLEQFSFVVSHNMRSPVANIKGFLSLYNRTLSTPENVKIVEYVENAAIHLDDILSDLNFILKNKETALENKEQINLKCLVNNICTNLSHEIEITKTEVQNKFSENISVFTIKSALTSVIYNLLQNSIKYRKNFDPPVVKISCDYTPQSYILKIEDNGIGIDLSKHRERLFTLYSRFHRNTDGKGIGLYLVKSHVEMLGGEIDVESVVNKGSTFIIKLPLN